MKGDQHSAASVPDAAAVNRSRKARLRLGRSLLPLLAAAVVLCAVVVWQRDARHIEAARLAINGYRVPLATYLADHDTLPLIYPHFPGQEVSDKTSSFTYIGQEVVKWARQADRPVIVGYGHVQGLIARPNGHPVIYYDKGELRVDWIAKSDLSLRLAEQRALARAEQAP